MQLQLDAPAGGANVVFDGNESGNSEFGTVCLGSTRLLQNEIDRDAKMKRQGTLDIKWLEEKPQLA